MPPTPPSPPRIALITGATGGLGTAVTHAFLSHGYTVLATYRQEDDAARLRQGTADTNAADRLIPIQADLANLADAVQAVQTAVTRFGRLDVLANLVGGWSGGHPIWETNPDEWDRTVALNLRTAFLISRAAAKQMVTQRYGRIIHVSSRSAVQPAAGVAAYSTSKMGVVTLTETLALELRDHGDITANCVLPSIIDTPANRRSMPKDDPTRWVRPDQLASIILWLASDEAAPISGAALPVYGHA